MFIGKNLLYKVINPTRRHYSRICPPPPSHATPIIKVSNNIASLGFHKKDPKPRQVLSLPTFPAKLQHPLPGRNLGSHDGKRTHVTAVTWLKYYFDEIDGSVIQSYFNKGLVQMECSNLSKSPEGEQDKGQSLRKINPNEVMEVGAKIHVPVSVAETKISKRFNVIPSGTLYPNADEIEYLQRLVMYKDSAIMILNKPPKLPIKGNLPVHNSMDALAAAALSYGFEEGPKLVHRLDRESSGLLLMGRTKESIARLHWLFSDTDKTKLPSKTWTDACEATVQRYWALVIGSPKEKQGVIRAPLSKVLLKDGKTERVVIAHPSGIEASQDAITEYRVLGPTINGCTWLELCPITGRKHQLRVHCAEALGTPIVGDYKYGWYVHSKWKQMPRVDFEQTTGKPYKMRRPAGLDVQKGSVLSKERIRRMQSVFHRERNKYKRSYQSWRENDQEGYHPQFQRNDWYWKTDTSYKDQRDNSGATPTHSGTYMLSHHYSVLGLDRWRTKPYTEDEIKDKSKLKEFHPDQNQDNKEAAEAKFKEVMTSYEAIKLEKKNGKS